MVSRASQHWEARRHSNRSTFSWEGAATGRSRRAHRRCAVRRRAALRCAVRRRCADPRSAAARPRGRQAQQVARTRALPGPRTGGVALQRAPDTADSPARREVHAPEHAVPVVLPGAAPRHAEVALRTLAPPPGERRLRRRAPRRAVARRAAPQPGEPAPRWGPRRAALPPYPAALQRRPPMAPADSRAAGLRSARQVVQLQELAAQHATCLRSAAASAGAAAPRS
jgi:hypothetical protein